MHNLCIINPFSDYVDSDDEEAPIEHFDDDGGPPQDLDDQNAGPPALEDEGAGPGVPGPVIIPHSSNSSIGMEKAMQLAGGDNYNIHSPSQPRGMTNQYSPTP